MTGSSLLLDNSAWARLDSSRVSEARAAEVGDAMDGGRVLVCLPFLLEAGYSARTNKDYAALMRTLSALPRATIDDAAEDRMIDAQGQLARAGHQRVPPVDVMLAALADRHGLGVLHYDRHFDAIADVTDLRFESVWLAPRGSFDEDS